MFRDSSVMPVGAPIRPTAFYLRRVRAAATGTSARRARLPPVLMRGNFNSRVTAGGKPLDRLDRLASIVRRFGVRVTAR